MKITTKERRAFDSILESILKELPDFVQSHLDQVTLLVEDEPSPKILKDMGIYNPRELSDLCGLHHGVPITERSITDNQAVSPAIYLFRGPIFRSLEDDETLEEQVRITLIHEFAHHFGFSDEQLDALGYG